MPWKKAAPHKRRCSTQWLSRKDFDKKEKIAAVTEIFDQMGIKELSEKRIQDFYDEALASLDRLNRPADRKAELYEFASYLKTRNR